jgi:hypothetical protein
MNTVDRWFLKAMLGLWVIGCAVVSACTVRHLDWSDHAESLPSAVVAYAMLVTAGTAVVIAIVAVPVRIGLNLGIPTRRRAYRTETLSLGSLVLMTVAWLWEGAREMQALAPPAGVTTLSEFAATMPAPTRLELMVVDGREYIVWTGEIAGPLALPSGPACYLFDDAGNLEDWQAVTGDGGRVEDMINAADRIDAIMLDDPMRRVRHQ